MKKQVVDELLLRYRKGQCTEQEIRKIHLWFESLNQEEKVNLSSKEAALLESRLWNSIESAISEPDVARVSSRWWQSASVYSGIAALLVLSLAYIGYYWTQKSPVSSVSQVATRNHFHSTRLRTVKNTTDHDLEVVLEDKSRVVLSPASQISYPEKFDSDKRQVELDGNAFFDIVKNPERPFFVYSEKLVTKVLGTSFRIKRNPQNKILEVEVITGKVSVFEDRPEASEPDSRPGNTGVLLTPNQKVTYYAEGGHLMTSLVDVPQVIVPPKEVYIKTFNNATFTEIISHLEKEFGVEIVLAHDRLQHCTFTGDLSELPLFDKLDLICKTNHASFEIKGTRILINGEGCE